MDIKNIYLKPLINPKINVGLNYQAAIPEVETKVEVGIKETKNKKRNNSNKGRKKNKRLMNENSGNKQKITSSKLTLNLKDDSLDKI